MKIALEYLRRLDNGNCKGIFIMNREQYQFFSIKTEQRVYSDEPSYDNTIKNAIEICQTIDKDSSVKTPEFVALVWKFIYNHA